MPAMAIRPVALDYLINIGDNTAPAKKGGLVVTYLSNRRLEAVGAQAPWQAKEM